MPAMPVMSQLEHYLSLTNKRETLLAANMANVDTPGYRTQDIDFASELTRAMTHEQLDGQSDGERVAVRKVSGLLERPDGNNVDLDREATLLSEVQLQHQMGTQLMKARFHQLLSAISGGGQ